MIWPITVDRAQRSLAELGVSLNIRGGDGRVTVERTDDSSLDTPDPNPATQDYATMPSRRGT